MLTDTLVDTPYKAQDPNFGGGGVVKMTLGLVYAS